MRAAAAIFVLSLCVAPARADFQYTESAQITGGALVSMMKAASIFSKKTRDQQKQAMAPQLTTRYVTADFMRLDRPDGTIQIIDLAGRRVIEINTLTKTYAIATFDQIEAALAAAAQQAQQAMQQANAQQAQAPQASPQTAQQNPQVTMTPEFHVTPVGPARPILNTPVNETKVEFDMVMTAQSQGPNGPATQNAQPGTAPNQQESAMIGMNLDMFLAPSVTGQEELAAFYGRLAKEIDWTPPAVFGVDARMGQGLRELQNNGQALKGFPMLTYASMAMAAAGQGASAQNSSQDSSQNTAQDSNPPQQNTTSQQPSTPQGVLAQKFGGLFGKKNNNSNSNSNSGSSSGSSLGDGSGSRGGNSASLLEMTMQVTSFSAGPIDKSVFAVPPDMTQVQQDPMSVLNGVTTQSQGPARQ